MVTSMRRRAAPTTLDAARTLPPRLGRRQTLAWLLGVAAACSRTSRSREAARRVVSLSPSTTEALFAVGAGGLLVGRSRYCDFPPEVAALPQIGGYIDPNLEAIVGLRPDLVVGARGPSGPGLTERLERLGIATYFPPTETFDEIGEMVRGLGERTGRSDDGRRAADDIASRVRAVEQSLAGRARPRVLLVFGTEPISVAGPRSFADEMLRRAGGDNVVTQGPTYPTLGLERIVMLDPDVVINASMAESRGAERIRRDTPGWAGVRAVREGRVTSLTDETVLRPGPRVSEGLSVIARSIHPDLPREPLSAPSARRDG